MNVIIKHQNKEWSVLSEDRDLTLFNGKTKFEIKLLCSQNNHNILEYECSSNCLDCKIK
jgi:hypothetical protein